MHELLLKFFLNISCTVLEYFIIRRQKYGCFSGEESIIEGFVSPNNVSRWIRKRVFLQRLEMDKGNAHEKHQSSEASCQPAFKSLISWLFVVLGAGMELSI